jgi:hypothetical protein
MIPKIDKHQLVFPDGNITKFPHPVSEMREFPDVYVVLVEAPIGEKFNENAYGVDGKGQILWRVAEVKHVREDSPYTGIGEKDGAALLHNWDGYTLAVDPKTGKILREQFTK